MRAKINQFLLLNTAPGIRDIIIVDEILRGFELRIRPTGTRVWYYRYRAATGQQRRLVVGHHPGVGAAEARQEAVVAAGLVARGIDPRERKRSMQKASARAAQSTLKGFLDRRYESWAKAHLKTASFQLQRIRVDFKLWLDLPISELTTETIERWRQRLRDSGKEPVTINRELQRLHAALAKAVEWKIIDRHPFTGIKPLRFDRVGIVRYLSAAEELDLREAMVKREEKLRNERRGFNKWLRTRGRPEFPEKLEVYCDHLQPLVLVALNTGLRRGELFQLLWKDVDLKAKWLTVAGETAKNGQTRRIPLNREAAQVLSAWQSIAAKSNPSSQVFPGVGGENLTTINTAWRALRKAARLEDFRFHDLRHHFASRLVQSGIDLNTVRELLGHAGITMVLRYAHLSPERLMVAVEHVTRDPRAGWSDGCSNPHHRDLQATSAVHGNAGAEGPRAETLCPDKMDQPGHERVLGCRRAAHPKAGQRMDAGATQTTGGANPANTPMGAGQDSAEFPMSCISATPQGLPERFAIEWPDLGGG